MRGENRNFPQLAKQKFPSIGQLSISPNNQFKDVLLWTYTPTNKEHNALNALGMETENTTWYLWALGLCG